MPLPLKKKYPSSALQQRFSQERFPQFKYSREKTTWTGELKPRQNSPTYIVSIKYRCLERPKVYVLHPTLHSNAPHTYADGSLCLYFPDDKSWDDQKFLANTILPWAAEWLYFYELWLATGQWYRPEVLHNGTKLSKKQFNSC
jgi:hypothetical protein